MGDTAVILKKGKRTDGKIRGECGYLTMKSIKFPVLLRMGILLKYMILTDIL